MKPKDHGGLLTFALSEYSLTFGTFAKVWLLLVGEIEVHCLSSGH